MNFLSSILATLFLAVSVYALPPGAVVDEKEVPPYILPDPLVCTDGTKVTNTEEWNAKRRPELLRLFESEIYGKTLVGKPDQLKFVVREEKKDARGGKATRLRVGILFEGKEEGRQMELLVYLPNDVTAPVPVFLGLNFDGNYTIIDDPDLPVPNHFAMGLYANKLKDNKPTEAGRGLHKYMWQVDLALEYGFGIATAGYGEIEPDADGHWKDGPRGLAHEPGNGDWGCIGAWAWGLSRAMDYLETQPRVDNKRVTVMGFSRLGKAAMWAAAQDTRFAAAISNASGAGGLALSKRIFGETVKDMVTRLGHWFTPTYAKYAENEAALPVDSHELAALIAPRPLLATSGTEDLWSDPHGEFLGLIGADPVYRLLTKEGIETKEWPGPGKLINDRLGYFLRKGKHDVTLEDWRAMLAFIPHHLGHSHPPVFATERYGRRLENLPEAERQTWKAWLETSDDWRRKQDAALDEELKADNLTEAKKAPHGPVFDIRSKTPKSYFTSDEAKATAEAILSYQLPSGGWSKAVGYNHGPRPKGTSWVHQDQTFHYAGTFDNRSTTEQIHFLALMHEATHVPDYGSAALRGLAYIFTSQYPTGGWPQCYPLEGGYHDAITLNDSAMQHVLEILLMAAEGKSGFGWLDNDVRAKARAAFDRGVSTLLKIQVRKNGKLGVWAAQYDPFTLQPVCARGFEPAGLSGGSESIDSVRFLFTLPRPSKEIITSIESALRWFAEHKVTDAKGQETWGRFYDLNTELPFYPGKNDGRCWPDYDDMIKANKGGYDFFGSKPADLIGKWADKWRKGLAKEKKPAK